MSYLVDSFAAGSVPVYVFEKHHHVLEAWEAFRGANIASLDYHTDCLPGFLHYASRSLPKSEAATPELFRQNSYCLAESIIREYRDGKSDLGDCIEKLNYDEHPDFAVRAGIAGTFFVLANSRGGVGITNNRVYDGLHQAEYDKHPLIVYAPPCAPGCKRQTHDDECEVLRANDVLNTPFLSSAIRFVENLEPTFFESYLLDIDLDYFRTAESLNPKEPETFLRLVAGARAITIALEPSSVQCCKLAGEQVDSVTLLYGLRSLLGKVAI